jgi:hypothetical protein
MMSIIIKQLLPTFGTSNLSLKYPLRTAPMIHPIPKIMSTIPT